MTSIAVYTACYGQYDMIRPAPSIQGVDFILFTDDSTIHPNGWQVEIRNNTWFGKIHPRMRAKSFKCLPHFHLPSHEYTLWIDASHEIRDAKGIFDALDLAEQNDGIAAHRHPRQSILTEAEASTHFRKYDGLPVLEQAQAYVDFGHPDDWGLWACGSLARVRHPAMDATMDDWYQECWYWTYQDQISLPFVMNLHGLRPAEFPYPQYNSPWFRIHAHNKDT